MLENFCLKVGFWTRIEAILKKKLFSSSHADTHVRLCLPNVRRSADEKHISTRAIIQNASTYWVTYLFCKCIYKKLSEHIYQSCAAKDKESRAMCRTSSYSVLARNKTFSMCLCCENCILQKLALFVSHMRVLAVCMWSLISIARIWYCCWYISVQPRNCWPTVLH